MNAILALLLSFDVLYMLSLVVDDGKAFLVVAPLAMCYLVFFGLGGRRPVHSLYAFLVIVLLFPKGGNNFGIFAIEELPQVSMFTIVQGIAALAICLNLLRSRPSATRGAAGRQLDGLDKVLFLIVILAFVMSVTRRLGGDYLTGHQPQPEELAWESHFLIAYVFFRGCMSFVREFAQLEKFFLIFIASGVAMVVESIAYVYLGLSLPLAKYVFHESGRYHSLFFFDFVSLVYVVFLAAGGLLYFAFARRSRILATSTLLLMLPLLATFQRTPVVALGIIIALGIMQWKRASLGMSLGIIGGLMAVCVTVLPVGEISMEGAQFFHIRPDYFESYRQSWDARLGSQLRGLEVVVHAMPYGMGTNRMPDGMVSPMTKTWFSDWAVTGEGAAFYDMISRGEHSTGSHNMFINIMGEYGILGLIALGMFFRLCWRAKRAGHGLGRAAQTSSYAVLCGIGFMGMFYHFINIWLWVPLLLLFVVVAVPQLSCEQPVGFRGRA